MAEGNTRQAARVERRRLPIGLFCAALRPRHKVLTAEQAAFFHLAPDSAGGDALARAFVAFVTDGIPK